MWWGRAHAYQAFPWPIRCGSFCLLVIFFFIYFFLEKVRKSVDCTNKRAPPINRNNSDPTNFIFDLLVKEFRYKVLQRNKKIKSEMIPICGLGPIIARCKTLGWPTIIVVRLQVAVTASQLIMTTMSEPQQREMGPLFEIANRDRDMSNHTFTTCPWGAFKRITYHNL